MKSISLINSILGHGIPPLLKAVTHLFPLDTYVSAPVSLQQDQQEHISKLPPPPIYALLGTAALQDFLPELCSIL